MESVMQSLPAITGIGLVSVLGATAGQTWDALMAGRSISDHARVSGFAGHDRAVPMAASKMGFEWITPALVDLLLCSG